MKNGILQFSLMLLTLTFLIATFPTEQDYTVYNDTLRLHILANSDSRADQDIKIAVRDLILSKFGSSFDKTDEISSAIMITADKIADIQASVNDYLEELEANYAATASITKEWYETRDYNSYTLPRGYYSSLVITLGKGEGQNWWCIMFPPLCTDLASEKTEGGESNGSSSAYQKYTVKFKALEIISDLFKKNG